MSVRRVDVNKWKKIPCSCGKMAVQTTLKYKQYWVRGWKCPCGESYIHPEDSLRISKLEKLKSVKVKIGIVGQSMVIRIPRDFTEVYNLEKGEQVELVPEGLRTMEIKVK